MTTHYCSNCDTTWSIGFTPQRVTNKEAVIWCPGCGSENISLPAAVTLSSHERLTKLESHDIPNIANHAKSLENRLTSLESLVGAMREKIPTKDMIIELIEDHLSNTGPESPLANHITTTINSYLDQYDFADEINRHLDNAEIKIIV